MTGAEFRARRKACGMSQGEVSRRYNVNKSAISGFETDRIEPGLTVLRALRKAYDQMGSADAAPTLRQELEEARLELVSEATPAELAEMRHDEEMEALAVGRQEMAERESLGLGRTESLPRYRMNQGKAGELVATHEDEDSPTAPRVLCYALQEADGQVTGVACGAEAAHGLLWSAWAYIGPERRCPDCLDVVSGVLRGMGLEVPGTGRQAPKDMSNEELAAAAVELAGRVTR